MKQQWQDIISNLLGVKPIYINSHLVSAQERKRLYWTNIPVIGLPKDKNILLKDIVQSNVSGYTVTDDAQRLSKRKLVNYKELTQKSIPVLAAMHKGSQSNGMTLVNDNGVIRRITPIECERLQTVPDNYTEGVSNTQRYKMLGNGWTVDVIAFILSHI